MIIGEYPCCNGDLWIPMPDKTPSYFPEDCPHCGAKVWHECSRMQSRTYTEKDFLERFTVDEATRSITLKQPEEPLNPELQALMDKAMQRAIDRTTEHMANILLYGEPGGQMITGMREYSKAVHDMVDYVHSVDAGIKVQRNLLAVIKAHAEQRVKAHNEIQQAGMKKDEILFGNAFYTMDEFGIITWHPAHTVQVHKSGKKS